MALDRTAATVQIGQSGPTRAIGVTGVTGVSVLTDLVVGVTTIPVIHARNTAMTTGGAIVATVMTASSYTVMTIVMVTTINTITGFSTITTIRGTDATFTIRGTQLCMYGVIPTPIQSLWSGRLS